MHNIIFLDIDGVLNTARCSFDRDAVANLCKITDETEADIVISSSWKLYGLDFVKSIWKEKNLPGQVIGLTPNTQSDQLLAGASPEELDNLPFKGYEIKEWLAENGREVKNYIIIDDENRFLPDQQSHFVQTDPESGISTDDAEKAIGILLAD